MEVIVGASSGTPWRGALAAVAGSRSSAVEAPGARARGLVLAVRVGQQHHSVICAVLKGPGVGGGGEGEGG